MTKESDNAWALLFGAWLVSGIATLGSLFFSEVMKFPPCTLCWYQRICMYPLVLLLLRGLFPLDRGVFKFAFPLVTVGGLIAAYHCLLYYRIVPESAAPCVQGISCTTVHIEWLGFITIPFLSLVAFGFVGVLLVLSSKEMK